MLRITKQTDYSIVLLSRMAQDAGQRFKAPELARQTNLPDPIVSKVLKFLAREGILQSHRGIHGGYTLSRPPSEISIAEVVTAMEGPIAVTECVDNSDAICDQEATCPMRTNWNQINLAIRQALEAIPLDQMAQPQPEKELVQIGDAFS